MDYAHALTSSLHMELPPSVRTYIRNNEEYYTRHMSEAEFAAATLRLLTPIQPPLILSAAKRVGAPMTESELEHRLAQLRKNTLL